MIRGICLRKRVKRGISLVLAASLLLFCLPLTAQAAGKNAVQEIIDEYYAAVSVVGKPHFNAGQTEPTLRMYADKGMYEKSVTPYGCPTHSGGCRTNTIGGARQCLAFAKYMTYILYGCYPTYASYVSVDGKCGARDDGWTYYNRGYSKLPTLQPGDFIRWYNVYPDLHAAIVYSVKGDEITLFDANNFFVPTGGNCLIQKSPLSKATFTRYYNNGCAYVARRTAKKLTASVTYCDGEEHQKVSQKGRETAQILYNREKKRPWFDASKITDMEFTDVRPEEWYVNAVNWAASSGYAVGYDDGSFGCDDLVTREQLVSILYRYSGKPYPKGSLDEFSDSGRVEPYAADAMKWAVGSGIIKGREDNLLEPSGTATRAEAAAIFMRLLKQ